jgi:hypothetical protein
MSQSVQVIEKKAILNGQCIQHPLIGSFGCGHVTSTNKDVY